MPFVRSIACCAIVIVALSPARSAIASNSEYPIPFDSRSDAKGYVYAYPSGPSALAIKTKGLQLPWIVLGWFIFATTMTDEAAAQRAYRDVLVKKAGLKYRPIGEYVVVIFFSPKASDGKIPFTLFLFTRDVNGRWQKRRTTSRAELSKIVYLVFHSPPAMESYPIPFNSEPDWRGFAINAPGNGGYKVSSSVLGHFVIVTYATSRETLSESDAAGIAYRALFKNAHLLRRGAAYIVSIIYGPSNSLGVHPEYAYIFARDAADHWTPRLVSEKELTAIECAIGRCPNI